MSIGINASQAFSPNKITGLILDLDASDLGTITDSGSPNFNVSKQDDKSGEGNDAIQNTGVRQPVTGVNTINGVNAIAWDITNDILLVSGNSSIDAFWATGGTIVFVSQSNSLGKDNVGRFFDNQGGWRINKMSGGTGSLRFVVGFSTMVGSFSTPDSSFPAPFDPSIVVLTYSAANTANVPNFHIDGAAQSVTTLTSPVGTYSPNTLPLGIGNRVTNFDRSFDGDFGRILFYNRIIDDSERTAIERSLSNEFGIVLP